MKKISIKIIIPTSVSLLVVFAALFVIVSMYTGQKIQDTILKDFDVLVNQLEGSVEELDHKLNAIQEIKYESAQSKLTSLVDNTISVMNTEYRKYVNGEISEETAKRNAVEIIRAMRYDDNNYFWIDDVNYTNILLPTNTTIEGTSRYDLQDKKGKYIIREMITNSTKDGDAFVQYWFPKPGETVESEKLGYVKKFTPWNWFVGTGFYIDNIDQEIQERRRADLLKFNDVIQSKTPEGAYPVIFGRDDRLYASPDSSKMFTTPKLLDPVTNEDIVQKAFSLRDGVLEYNFTASDGEIDRKIGIVKYYEERDWIILYTLDSSVIMNSVYEIQRIILFVASIAMLIAIALLAVISSLVSKDIKLITKAVYEISEGEGDLTKEITSKSKDETGQLAGYFNKFILKLKDIVDQIKEVGVNSSEIGDTLASNTDELSATVEEISSTMRSIESKTKLLTTEVSESNNNVNKITESIGLLKQSTDKESAYVSESSAAVEQMVASIKAISNISREKNEAINGLTTIAKAGEKDMELTVNSITTIEESTHSMLKMIDIINDVSDRINLLAMNAAIEAAHAGEAGKGFAVVADEIRKLASLTAQSTADMATTLQSVSQSIVDAAQLSGRTGETIKSITLEVIDVSQSLSEMLHSFSELSEGTKQITDSLSRLVQTSSDVSSATDTIDKNAFSIISSLSNVTDISNQNSNGISEISEAINEISIALLDLKNLSNKNSENIVELNSAVNNFKTE